MIFKTQEDLDLVIKLNKPETVIRMFWVSVEQGKLFNVFIDTLEDKYKELYPEEKYIDYLKEQEVTDQETLEVTIKPIIQEIYYEEDSNGNKVLKDEYKDLPIRPTFEYFKQKQIEEFLSEPSNLEIDMNNYIPLAKEILFNRVNSIFTGSMDKITNKYPEQEKLTWYQQEKEAQAYKADSNANVPLLTNIANRRGISIDELADKILAKSEAYTNIVGIAIGDKQNIEDMISNVTTLEDLDAINIKINKLTIEFESLLNG